MSRPFCDLRPSLLGETLPDFLEPSVRIGGSLLSRSPGWLQYPLFLGTGNESEASGRSSTGVMSGGEGAEDEDDPLASRVAGIGGGGVLAATEAAAECRDSRAWSIVNRV
jgi:hypothetical protein